MRALNPRATKRQLAKRLQRRARLRAGGAFWLAVSGLSLGAFKLAQVRLQPEAIATGVPGILFRFVVLPLELALALIATAQVSPVVLATALITMSGLAIAVPLRRHIPIRVRRARPEPSRHR